MKPYGATKQDWGRSDEPSTVNISLNRTGKRHKRKTKKDTCANMNWKRSIKKRARQEAKAQINNALYQIEEDYRLTLQELLFLESLD